MRFGLMCLWFDLLSSDVANCDVIWGTTPVLLYFTKNYNILIHYYSNVLLCTTRTTPALLFTTIYYSITTPYYKILRQYYSVLLQYYWVLTNLNILHTVSILRTKKITPTLLCTTPVLQSTIPILFGLHSYTPVVLCTAKNYANKWRYYSNIYPY